MRFLQTLRPGTAAAARRGADESRGLSDRPCLHTRTVITSTQRRFCTGAMLTWLASVYSRGEAVHIHARLWLSGLGWAKLTVRLGMAPAGFRSFRCGIVAGRQSSSTMTDQAQMHSTALRVPLRKAMTERQRSGSGGAAVSRTRNQCHRGLQVRRHCEATVE